MGIENEYVTRRELAAMAGLSLRHIERLIREGTIRTVSAFNRCFIERTEAERFVAARAAGKTA